MDKIEIRYNKETDLWEVTYFFMGKIVERKYGSLKTMLGALQDMCQDIQTLLKKWANNYQQLKKSLTT